MTLTPISFSSSVEVEDTESIEKQKSAGTYPWQNQKIGKALSALNVLGFIVSGSVFLNMKNPNIFYSPPIPFLTAVVSATLGTYFTTKNYPEDPEFWLDSLKDMRTLESVKQKLISDTSSAKRLKKHLQDTLASLSTIEKIRFWESFPKASLIFITHEQLIDPYQLKTELAHEAPILLLKELERSITRESLAKFLSCLTLNYDDVNPYELIQEKLAEALLSLPLAFFADPEKLEFLQQLIDLKLLNQEAFSFKLTTSSLSDLLEFIRKAPFATLLSFIKEGKIPQSIIEEKLIGPIFRKQDLLSLEQNFSIEELHKLRHLDLLNFHTLSSPIYPFENSLDQMINPVDLETTLSIQALTQLKQKLAIVLTTQKSIEEIFLFFSPKDLCLLKELKLVDLEEKLRPLLQSMQIKTFQSLCYQIDASNLRELFSHQLFSGLFETSFALYLQNGPESIKKLLDSLSLKKIKQMHTEGLPISQCLSPYISKHFNALSLLYYNENRLEEFMHLVNLKIVTDTQSIKSQTQNTLLSLPKNAARTFKNYPPSILLAFAKEDLMDSNLLNKILGQKGTAIIQAYVKENRLEELLVCQALGLISPSLVQNTLATQLGFTQNLNELINYYSPEGLQELLNSKLISSTALQEKFKALHIFDTIKQVFSVYPTQHLDFLARNKVLPIGFFKSGFYESICSFDSLEKELSPAQFDFLYTHKAISSFELSILFWKQASNKHFSQITDSFDVKKSEEFFKALKTNQQLPDELQFFFNLVAQINEQPLSIDELDKKWEDYKKEHFSYQKAIG